MNRIKCFLTGGHYYHPSKMVTTRNITNRTIILNNYCTKCGKLNTFEIPEEYIDVEIKKFKLKEWSRWSK